MEGSTQGTAVVAVGGGDEDALANRLRLVLEGIRHRVPVGGDHTERWQGGILGNWDYEYMMMVCQLCR